ncbi:MAG: hypothetical protein K8Q97_01455 [Candidatus Andersenbacteria bacterium]|nr:hypothetical protein [Candidatus Andersenbacteria bacterium]
MLGSPFSVTITADAVAWYGAIIASIAFATNAYNIFRDRPKVTISYQENMNVINHPSYDPNQKYLSVTVTNRGRRSLRIEKGGYRVLGNKDGKHVIFAASFTNDRNIVLTEENPSTNFIVRQDIDMLKNVYYLWAIDGTGKMYKKYLHIFPIIWRIWQWTIYNR